MKANELSCKDLMVDDWVGIKITQHNTKVTNIDANSVYTEAAFPIRYDEIESIPLTTEILEKNGFGKVLDEDGIECYRYYNCAADGYIKISLYDGGDDDWSIEIVNYEKFDDNEIVYNNNFIFLKVHQFQHALRLCGINKTIEL